MPYISRITLPALPAANSSDMNVAFSSVEQCEHHPKWKSAGLLILACSLASMLLSCANRQVVQADPAIPRTEVPASQEPLITHYKDYFKSLNLPYMEPLGCSQAKPCQLVADFNDDGIKDLASLYEYSGPTDRIEANYVDLVILYSTKGSAHPTHQIFRYAGGIDKRNHVLARLEKQEAGELTLPLGTIKLPRPAINVRRDDQELGTYFPTYYWTGRRFASIDKSAD